MADFISTFMIEFVEYVINCRTVYLVTRVGFLTAESFL